MQRIIKSAIQATACLLLAVAFTASAQDKKADPTGTWTWVQAGRDGGPGRTNTLTLKLEGDKLTGSVSGRQADTAIADGKVAGDEISFKVTREFGGGTIVQKYSGKLSGDTITGKIESERDGQPQSRDWVAKKAAK